MTEEAEPGPLVSGEWAEQHLEDPDARFIELSYDTLVYDGSWVEWGLAHRRPHREPVTRAGVSRVRG